VESEKRRTFASFFLYLVGFGFDSRKLFEERK
jgi:hypothetical protein